MEITFQLIILVVNSFDFNFEFKTEMQNSFRHLFIN